MRIPPAIRYGHQPGDATPEISGNFDILTGEGRSGWIARSVHDRLRLPDHTLGKSRGSLTMWVCSVDDLASWTAPEHIERFEPGFLFFPLLIAEPDSLPPRVNNATGQNVPGPLRQNWESAEFALMWSAHWYPQFFAKFHPGPLYKAKGQPGGMYDDPTFRAFVGAGHWALKREKWYQIGLTWDHSAGRYRLYVNGILMVPENRFAAQGFEYLACTRALLAGSTTFAMGDVEFYDVPLLPEDLADIYRTQATAPDQEIDQTLRRIYEGLPEQGFSYDPDSSWHLRMNESLSGPEAVRWFIQQGMADAVEPGEEGLRVSTHRVRQRTAEGLDRSQGYLWTKDTFAGDLVLDFEFQPLQPNGLALLCIRATGMQGEDFLADYPLRTDGSMALVFGENVRLYHWEYWREMDDTRNDVASHALIKGPFLHPMAYHCQPKPITLGEWHRLQFVQTGNRLRGAIDGKLIFDVHDDGHAGHGPVYRDGHIGFRSMYKTDIRYRNLRIWTRDGFRRNAVGDL